MLFPNLESKVLRLDSDKKVKENIIFPLKERFEKEKFDGKFTLPVHAFAGYGEG